MTMVLAEKTTSHGDGEQKPAVPSISLPKGGGAIRGIGEKFAANPMRGTGGTGRLGRPGVKAYGVEVIRTDT
jgi:hypothetical protein